MIRFDAVTVTYADQPRPAIVEVDLSIEEGELCLVAGATGTGKSTLLGAMCGLVPHFTGGHLAGRVVVGGRDTRTHRPRDLADLVGVVRQDPLAGCVTDSVEEELAFTMEQLGVAPAVMRKRVEETLDLLGLAALRGRPLRDLSGGEQQRVAIGAALTAHPRVLLLDEPTSALDPTAAEDVLAAVTRLVHDLGVTAVIAEHRLERVVQYADRVVHVRDDGRVESGPPAEVMAVSSVAPPIVELGRLAGWTPLPLSVRDARRLAPSLAARLPAVPPARPDGPRGAAIVRAKSLSVRFGEHVAVRPVDLDVHAGEILAVMGRNGAGKSSLLWALHGAGPRSSGTVSLPSGTARVALVPQSPSDLLYLESVKAECAQADREAGAAPGTTSALLDTLTPGVDTSMHPRDLSEGQQLALVLAIQLSGDPPLVELDEPTRGLDYGAKHALGRVLAALAAQGRAVIVATHDVEFVASVATRVIVLADGEVVADGPTADVVVASPSFAPQVAKILAPLPWLTVEAVRTALAS